MKKIIELEKVTKVYHGHAVVNDLNIDIEKGEIFGLLGLNGSGKTTTIKMLLGLVEPTEGQIRYFGLNFKTKSTRLLRRIGCLIEPPGYYEHLSVYDNLKLISNIVGYHKSDYIGELLNIIGIDHIQDVQVNKLSHSDRQLLAIARALLNNPDVLILDEPLNGLEAAALARMRTLLLRLAKERGITIVISTHVISEIEKLADRIGILHEGELVQIIDHDELELFSSTKYTLHASNIDKAVVALRKHDVEYNVMSRNFISISTEHEIDYLFEILLNDDTKILELYPQHQTLDDQFSDLISLVNRGQNE
jgi:bacitracin transport system ATP-binding protein